ncbi:Hsp20/alpha crystallin family protein [Sphingomonas cannabina]|uniref:Hsp20/alpha crystallin family protein n=1 Tax=Sphingomonas cannabina TaxID=2899123 RepID=UPI001F492160|nr:Hsp20/alpha crystallin family protein [Sphingomonas cannabina]UIJ46328.1 Hsp20/alpha crystallin family protein [Sphingomonas cannabina]
MNELSKSPARRQPAPSPFGWLRTEIDRLFDDVAPARSFLNLGLGGFAPVPALEMTSGDKAYRLTAELPGMKEEDIELSVAEGVLTLKGEKRSEEEHGKDGRLLSERSYGSFARRITLPSDVDFDRIAAEFDKGVLTVTLPRNAEAVERTRKIAIGHKG